MKDWIKPIISYYLLMTGASYLIMLCFGEDELTLIVSTVVSIFMAFPKNSMLRQMKDFYNG